MYGPNEPYSAASLPPSNPYEERSTGRTRQEDKASSDINNIMSRYLTTKELPATNREVFFADVTQVPDFQSAQNRVIQVREAFYQLPPKVRERFQNNPAKFLDFTADPENRDELVSMGLLDAPTEVTEAAARRGDQEREEAEERTSE